MDILEEIEKESKAIDDEMKAKGLKILEDSDYQKEPICVFCGGDLTEGSWDWFRIDKKLEGCGHWGKKCLT